MDGEAVAVYIRTSTGAKDRYFFVKDHLGSSSALVHGDGAISLRQSFDAFGKRRGTAWTGVPTAGQLTTANTISRRGYTFHEHLDSTDLIHMSGRAYDPLIGRFISADPFVPDPFETQSFNRYSYVNNRPLSFTDPSGYWPDDPDNDDPPVLPCGWNPSSCPPPTRPGFGFPVFPGLPEFTPGYGIPFDGWRRPIIIPPYRTVVGGPGVMDEPVPARPNDAGHVARDPIRPPRRGQVIIECVPGSEPCIVDDDREPPLVGMLDSLIELGAGGPDPDVMEAGGRGRAVRRLLRDIRDVRRDARGAQAASHLHHAWPKYLGGPSKQDLAKLPKSVHDAYHSGLDKILPRQRGTTHYLSPAARRQMHRDLADYTKAFDAKHGTRLYDSMIRNGFPRT